MNINEFRLSPASLMIWISLTLIFSGLLLSGLSLLNGGFTDQNMGLMLSMGEIIGGMFILIIGAYFNVAIDVSAKTKEF